MRALQQKRASVPAMEAEPRQDDDVAPDLDALFRRYSPYVAFIAHRLTGSPPDVDDIVQDVFLDAERGVSKLRDINSIKPWLATITVRRVRKHLKRRRFRQFIGLDHAPSYREVADAAASPEHQAMLSSIYRMLDTFSADERIAWTLKFVHGENVNQVAKLCGCSRATAHRRIAMVQAVIRGAIDER